MRKALVFTCLAISVSLACDLSVSVGPSEAGATQPGVTAAVADPAVPSPTPAPPTSTATLTPIPGVEITVDPVSLVLSPDLAAGASGLQFPRAEGADVFPSETTPGHVQIRLEGYILQAKFHEPQIYVYPAQAYAEMRPAAFESIRRLDNILYGSTDPLPTVPFFNATPVFASNVKLISFQAGQGVRSLTAYAQYNAPVNNHELFYHFQGLTRDGAYYIIAILPITAPLLQANADAGAIPPPGGIPQPDPAAPAADWSGYYAAVTGLLEATAADAFHPTLGQLDALIQSMDIAR
jgi:hypothetical protein